MNAEEIKESLNSNILNFVEDEDLIDYLTGMLVDMNIDELAQGIISNNMEDENPVYGCLAPFLQSSDVEEEIIQKTCIDIGTLAKQKLTLTTSKSSSEEKPLKLKNLVSMSNELQTLENDEQNKYMWGTLENKALANKNKPKEAATDVVSAKDKRKQRQELERARREYEAKLKEAEEEEKEMSKMILPDYSAGVKDRDIILQNVSLSLDNGKSILDSAELRLVYQRRFGIIGKNGIGKTTLLKAIASLSIPGFPKHHRVLHVRQELPIQAHDITVIQAVLDSDVERTTLMEKEKEINTQLQNDNVDTKALLKQLDEIYARLSIIGSENAHKRATSILSGLQFSAERQAATVSSLSGGWRVRLALACALFIQPDLLLLDEPTNHLDLEAVLWLQSYLLTYKHTLVVVSHDRTFLNEVCTDVIHFHNLTLTYYRGNYDNFTKTLAENTKNAQRQYEAYKEKRQHMVEFIEKFRANAKRATLVQSRIKALAKMDLEAPEEVVVEAIWRFGIPPVDDAVGRPIINIDDATFDYEPKNKSSSDYILQKVNFGIALDSRIAIVGRNGAGKSTLLNLIMDKITPISGSIYVNPHLRIAHFTQHSAQKFDLKLSSLENLLQQFDNATDQEMRNFLGKFQIQGADAVKPMMLLSGGQKSRVAFAALAYQKPHVIIMDEPTNHLDMDAIDALVEALMNYNGGLIVVSHDQFFISKVCTELWCIGEGKATRFRGDFLDYKKMAVEKTKKSVEESVAKLNR